MTTQRTALLGLFKRKDKAPEAAPPKAGPSPDKFSVKPEMVKPGAYFWVRGKEIQPLDATGRRYPEKIKGNQHIEATGRIKKDLIEVRFKGSRVWVLLSDLARPLQSKKTAAGGSDEATFNTTTHLADFLRVLLKNGDKRELKITTKTRKALSEATSVLLDAISDWRYSDDELTPSEYISDVCSGSQKTAASHILDMTKNRNAYTAGWKNTKTGKSGDGRLVDHLIAACVLLSATLRGSTSARADFLFEHLPTTVAKAGGSSLQAAVIKAMRQHLKWSDVEKGRAVKEKKEKAPAKKAKKPAKKAKKPSKKKASVIEACTDVEGLLTQYTPVLVPGQGKARVIDLIFQVLRQYGPTRAWDGGVMQNPKDMVHVLSAWPAGNVVVPVDPRLSNPALPKVDKRVVGIGGIEKSVQLCGLADDLVNAIIDATDMGRVFAPQEDNVSLMELLVKYTEDAGTAMRAMELVQKWSWYGQLVDHNGFKLKSLKAVHGLYACLHLYLATCAEDDYFRALSLHCGVEAIDTFKLLPATVVAGKIRTHFPWATVANMLHYRTKQNAPAVGVI